MTVLAALRRWWRRPRCFCGWKGWTLRDIEAHQQVMHTPAERAQHECQGADFSRVFAHLDQGLREHADRDGLTGVKRAVFLDRGGHAPGQACPSEQPQDRHFYMCQYPDDECTCHLYGHDPEARR